MTKRKHEEIKVKELPCCDFCSGQGFQTRASYDGRTKQGPWANMCEMHMRQWGLGIGLGLGQRLILKK